MPLKGRFTNIHYYYYKQQYHNPPTRVNWLLYNICDERRNSCTEAFRQKPITLFWRVTTSQSAREAFSRQAADSNPYTTPPYPT